ncbi:MAG: ROK family protein [Kofleriaceae bacterium]
MPVLGIDLGGTKLLACGLDDDDATRYRVRLPTGRAFGPAAALDAIEGVVRDARRVLGTLDAIGIGVPGLVDHRRGSVFSSTILEGWTEVPLADTVSRRVDLPCTIDNDVNVAAIHEHHVRDASELLYVAIGTGIGGALVLDGTLRRGARGVAGELGHVCIERAGPRCACGRRGCVALYASGTALGPSPTDAAVRDAAEALAVAIGSVLNVLDVPLVVLGGGVVELGPTYVERVAARVRQECFREIGDACVIEVSRAGYDTAALGAAMLARQPRSPAIARS